MISLISGVIIGCRPRQTTADHQPCFPSRKPIPVNMSDIISFVLTRQKQIFQLTRSQSVEIRDTGHDEQGRNQIRYSLSFLFHFVLRPCQSRGVDWGSFFNLFPHNIPPLFIITIQHPPHGWKYFPFLAELEPGLTCPGQPQDCNSGVVAGFYLVD